MSLPRIARSARSDSFVRSRPWYIAEPPTTRPARGSRPRVASDVTLFPHPDSPTMASVSPGAMSKLIPLTACTVPRLVQNWTRRSLIASSGSRPPLLATPSQLRVERLAETVADQVEREHRDQDREARDDREKRPDGQVLVRIGEHRSPLRR